MPTNNYIDFLSSMEAGVNSGLEPLLLAKNQLAEANNCSVRGAYVTHRPPVIKKALDFGGSTTLQSLVQNGVFQGAGYYRPDYGTESLLASISGHIFKFTENGLTWGVTDVSVPNDLNDSSVRQCWMWQSEKWQIISDGSGKLPIFFDGTNSRRSLGDTQVWGTTNSAFTPPAIGATVSLTLTSNYLGLFNVPVLLNGEYYQPMQNASGYNVILQNINAVANATVVAGTQVIVVPTQIGTVVTGSSGSQQTTTTVTPPFSIALSLTVSNTDGISVGDSFSDSSTSIVNGNPSSVTITSIDAVNNILGVSFNFPSGYYSYQVVTVTIGAGNKFQTTSSNRPNVVIGNLASSFTVPAIGSSIVVQLDTAYTGASDLICTINGYEYYITSQGGVSSGNILIVQNISDTTTQSVAAGATIMSVPELPAGRMGAYGQGRNWMCGVDGLTFMGADIIGGAAGTPANNYRDSVLKNTENTFLAGGGSFALPGAGEIITAMTFPAILDASLGQGALEISTASSIFSCNVPVDRNTWETMTSPVLSVTLKDRGALGQWSTISVNSDTMFRGWDGLGSLILARRDFSIWGNMPISQKPLSQEMSVYLNADDQTLLSWGSSVVFDNRYLTTLAPTSSGRGVFHEGLISMNLDTVSNLQQQLPPVYDGLWTGLNVLQKISGIVNGKKRDFAFCLNLTLNQIELYEFMPATTTSYWDNDTTPIVWDFNLPIAFNKDVKPLTELCQLRDGEVYLKDIKGDVNVQVYYRPDYYPCWTLWNQFDVCSDMSQTDSQPGYRTRIGLGEPDSTPCEVVNNRPLRNGYFFQFRYVITGSCKWMGMRASAVNVPQPSFAPIIQ